MEVACGEGKGCLVAGVDGDRVLAEVSFRKMERLTDFFGKLPEAIAALARKTDRIGSLPASVFAEIGFVQNEEVGGVGGRIDGAFGAWLACIGHFEKQVGILDLPGGALDSLGFDFIGGFPDARCIDEAERDAVEVDDFLDRIPGGACDIGHDGAVEAKEPVEEGGFADVGFPENHRADTFAEDASLVGGGEERVDCGEDALDTAAELDGCLRIDVFIGEVDPGF